jgi:hypothetical protein
MDKYGSFDLVLNGAVVVMGKQETVLEGSGARLVLRFDRPYDPNTGIAATHVSGSSEVILHFWDSPPPHGGRITAGLSSDDLQVWAVADYLNQATTIVTYTVARRA